LTEEARGLDKRRLVFIGLAAVAIILVFQFFFRYQYIHTVGIEVLRVDRLTGASCVLPCLPPTPTPVPTVKPTPPPHYLSNEDQRAIAYAKAHNTSDLRYSASYFNKDPDDFKWSVSGRYKNDGTPQSFDAYVSSVSSTAYPVRLVCFCDSKDWGWRWEVHLDTGEVYDVGDNADLRLKYGIKPH
jgi:hypothetical protein